MNAQVPVIWHDYTGRIIAQSYIPSKRDIDYYKRDYPLAAHGVVAEHVSEPENYLIIKRQPIYSPIE
jgi:hypothetical protein|tara:strand:+ start:97 stop:297 length:201 start_codon:yes stop_codon:yes gene_type:complete